MNKLWLASVVVALILLAGGETRAWGKTQVVFTIDVESIDAFPLPTQVNSVCKGGSACSLMKIAQLLKDRGLAGTFFLNVYEHQRWGEAVMKDIAVNLQLAGHDVALHTHPQWAYDSARWAMFQYSLDEQTTIIRDGIKLLESWTGYPVVAHRAGAYTANQNTIEALKRNGIRIDSSLFWKHPWSHLNELNLLRNLPSSWRQITEIPVTVYQREDRSPILGNFLSPVVSIRKIDPDWFLSTEEAISAIDAVIKADIPFLVVFLHSYSFMKSQGNNNTPIADQHALEIFHVILNFIAEKDLPVVTMRDLAKADLLPITNNIPDVVPQVTNHISLFRYVWYRVKSIEMGEMIAIATAILALVLGSVILLIMVHRKRLTVEEE